jgi:predicted amino acid-binding ACT domain protein
MPIAGICRTVANHTSMLVLDFVRDTPADQPSILLPRIHSGHLGFVPGTRVHVATPAPASRPADMRTEVLVTPFHTTPENTALVSVVLHDAVGVVRSLVQALSWLNINIEVQESSSIDHLDLHRVGMIVDLGRELTDEDTPERVQQLYRAYAANVPIHSRRYIQLFDMIVAQCGDALWWHTYERGRRIPALYVRPLTRRDELNPSTVILNASKDKRHTEIKLPENVADHIRNRLASDGKVPARVSYIFVSDTNERALRTMFLPEDKVRRMVHVGLYHNDQAGTLARLLEVIAAAEFNIVTSLLRKHSERTSAWEAVLEYQGVDAPPKKPSPRGRLPEWYRDKLIPWIHSKLLDSPEIHQIDGCSVSIGPPLYPPRYGGADPDNRMDLSSGSRRTEDPPRPTNATMIGLIDQRNTDVENSRLLPPDRDDAEKLLKTVASHRARVRQRTLFLSYPASCRRLVEDYLRAALQPPRRPAYHLTQFQDSRPPDIQEQIINLIQAADYFLAIWHPDDDNAGQRVSPLRLSPWMFFEHGVAHALKKPTVVACHKGLDTANVRRLVGNAGMIMYTDANFAKDRVPVIQSSCQEVFRDDREALFNDDPPDEARKGGKRSG